MEIKVKTLSHYDKALPLPSYQTIGSVGADVHAQLAHLELKDKKLVIKPGERVLIPTAICFEIPHGYEIQVRPRSGLSLKSSLLIVNSPGTIDSDYRGELQIIMGNFGDQDAIIKHGDRVAQLVVSPIIRASFILSDELSKTKRSEGGMGHTGD
ncbi:MAG: dUTP diphosphatase [Oligoflexia bacterium]|nr:dUTP diphosphatase [Oligoflexia bacterium]